MAWESHNSYLGNEEEGRERGIKKKMEKRRVREEGSKGFGVCVGGGFSYSLCMQIERRALSVRKKFLSCLAQIKFVTKTTVF